ncbi:MAG: hypothetical protein HFJ55_03160, partial [Clostridia bacterium]|nr:hypothetical protein [Clostridia bacterium]
MKRTSGITMISLVIGIVILIIISGMLIYNSKSGIQIRNYKWMQNDIEVLGNEIDAFYIKYGALPILHKYTNIKFEPQPNDSQEYYIIDLAALDGFTLNYGKDYEKSDSENLGDNDDDIYIIDKQSHHIYYAKGIEMDGIVYYTNTTDNEVSYVDVYPSNIEIRFQPDGGELDLIEESIDIDTVAIIEEFSENISTIKYAWSQDNTTMPTELTDIANIKAENEIIKPAITEEGTWYLYVEVINRKGKVVTKWSEAFSIKESNYLVAETGDTTKTLAQAVAKANTNNNIKVLRSNFDNSDVSINKSLTINTNEKTVTRNKAININNNSLVNIDGNGNINGNINETTTEVIANNGELTILNVNINAVSKNGDLGDGVANYGTARIEGGTISSESGNAIYNLSGGRVIISGGLIVGSAANQSTLYNKEQGIVEMIGGEIKAESSTAIKNQAGGQVTISGENTKVNSNMGFGVYNNGIVQIEGGTISSESSNAISNQAGAQMAICGTAKINSNTNPSLANYGTTQIEGGTISSESSNAIVNLTGAQITINGGQITSNASSKPTLYNYEQGIVRLTGGEIKAKSSNAIYNKAE